VGDLDPIPGISLQVSRTGNDNDKSVLVQSDKQ